jgi:hypothetical protein
MSGPPRGRTGGGTQVAALVAMGVLAAAPAGCKKKVTQEQCEQIVDHFAELVVKERLSDAGPEVVAAERARERQEARHADEFKNCRTEVQEREYECAMKAESTDAVLKCLE